MKDFSPLAITDAAVGFPAKLGVITRTDGTIYRWAESDTAITVSGDTFEVVPGLVIKAVSHFANGEMPSAEIWAVHENGGFFNSADLDIGLFDGAAVQLYIVDRMDLSAKGLLFTGSIANISYDPTTHQVIFAVKGPAVNAKILMTQKFAPMCRTDLFSILCGLDASDYDVPLLIETVIDAFNFTVTNFGGPAPADGYFNQGVAVTAGGTAFEIANWVQSTQIITAYLPCSRLLTPSAAITLYPGCNKTMDGNGCPKFNNQLNFQGEPHWLGTAASAQQV